MIRLTTFCLLLLLLIPKSRSFAPLLLLSRQRTSHPLIASSTTCSATDTSVDSPILACTAQWIDHVDASLRNQTFVSLVIAGPSKKTAQAAGLRGALRQLSGRLIALGDDVYFQATLKYHLATDVAKNWPLDNVAEQLRAMLLNPESNPTVWSEWGGDQMLGEGLGSPRGIRSAQLQTTTAVHDLQLVGKPRLIQRNGGAQAEIQAHNRPKQGHIDRQADFLQALGVVNAQGKPRPGMAGKLRQCQKFVEIVSGLVEATAVDEGQAIDVVDMGCGRGYLTFSLHSHLAGEYPLVHSLGVDVRPKLVDEISSIAQSLGPTFDGLEFCTGTIQDFTAPEASSALSILIALHACDTATDDALWSAMQRQASIIVVAPCCHRQLRPQINRHASTDHPLADILRHNVYRERTAETTTDALRALLLEYAGYRTQIFEFIGGEHTAKNCMITGVKRSKAPTDKERQHVLERIQSLAGFYGIHEQQLAQSMGVPLTNNHDEPMRPLNARKMPPL